LPAEKQKGGSAIASGGSLKKLKKNEETYFGTGKKQKTLHPILKKK